MSLGRTLTSLFGSGQRRAVTDSPANSVQTDEIIGRHTLLWLLITNIAVLTPLYDKITLWTTGICAICFVWRVGIYLGQVAKPPRLLVTLIAIGAAITLALVSGDIGILNALINLLILGYAMKYIEMSSRRDVRVVVMAGYFLIALTFIDHQSMYNTLHLLLVCIINTCVLLSLYREQQALADTAKMGTRLILQSLPFALLLFLVLPRFGPLWMVPQMKSSQTGLSDKVGFGDIQRLTRSADLAFRATFEGAVPANAALYWRALVMEAYDGKHWRQNPGIHELERNAFVFQPDRERPGRGSNKQMLNYQIIAEPSRQHWLFGIDQAYSDSQGVINLPDYRLYSIRSVDQRLKYSVQSRLDAPMDLQLSDSAREFNLRLPKDSNPRTLALALDFRRHYPEPKARLAAMMQYFTKEPYFYTLRPPPVGPQQIDDFLFENKAGFCVHYASALAFMARAGGLPARLVTGYQGGEFNPQAGYLSVYQYMAHAWTEVWLEGQGWQRFDPTAMIAPNRIEQGFDDAFDSSDSYLLDNPLSTLRFKSIPWLNELRWQLASLDYYWSVWVLGFDSERQNQVLKKLLGDVSNSKLAFFMFAAIALIGVGIAYAAGLFSFRRHRDPISHSYERLCSQLHRQGLGRELRDGPSTLAHKVRQAFPELAGEFAELTRCYLALKYQSLPKERRRRMRRLFNRRCRRFNLLLLGRRLNSKIF